MLAISLPGVRSCAVGVPDCVDTMALGPDPLIILLFAVVAIGLMVTIILGVRRRQQTLRRHDRDRPVDGTREDPDESRD